MIKNKSKKAPKLGTKWWKSGRGKDNCRANYQCTYLKHERGISSDVVGSREENLGDENELRTSEFSDKEKAQE